MKRVIRRRSGTDNKNEQGPFFKKDKENQTFFGKSTDRDIPVSKPDAPSEKQADRMANQYIAGVQTQPEEASSSVQNEEKEQLQAQSDDNKREEEEIVQSKTEEISEEEEKVQSKTEEVSEEEKDKEVQTKTEEVTEEKDEEMVQSQSEDKEEEDVMQSKGTDEPAPTAVNNFSQKLAQTKGKGSPMPPSLNEEMSEYFGKDLSTVSIHTSETAVQLCSQIGARAFTHGNDIYFNEGKYKPDTSEGRHLLVHELTHVVQQGNNA